MALLHRRAGFFTAGSPCFSQGLETFPKTSRPARPGSFPRRRFALFSPRSRDFPKNKPTCSPGKLPAPPVRLVFSKVPRLSQKQADPLAREASCAAGSPCFFQGPETFSKTSRPARPGSFCARRVALLFPKSRDFPKDKPTRSPGLESFPETSRPAHPGSFCRARQAYPGSDVGISAPGTRGRSRTSTVPPASLSSRVPAAAPRL
jgi:hypothetical protein